MYSMTLIDEYYIDIMKNRLSCILLMLFAVQGMMAQLTSLGLVEESKIGKDAAYAHTFFIPEIKFVGESMLYTGTPTGLYKCDIGNLDAVQWEKLPITDDIIEDFEVRGDTVIVLSRKELLLSVDGGVTTERRFTDSVFIDSANSIRQLHNIAVHPHDAKRIYIAHQLGYLSSTTDFGESWNKVGSIGLTGLYYSPHNSNYLVAYYNHPILDETSMCFSRDGGMSWTFSDLGEIEGGYSATFRVAFHPTDKDKLVACGNIGLVMSNNGGVTWEYMTYASGRWSYPIVSIYDIVYDKRNPDILYGANMYTGLELDTDTMKVVRSADGGLTWHEFFVVPMVNKGLLRMDLKDNILALYTSANGIYLLDVDAVDTSIPTIENETSAALYYDLQGRPVAAPTRGIYIKDGKKIAID